MESESKCINEKREYLHKLIEENSFNLLSDEIVEFSQELDNLIYEYYQNKASSDS